MKHRLDPPRAAEPARIGRFARWLGGLLPKGLYARSLIIIIAPVVLLQSVIAYVFMERHWQLVTRRLSAAVTADIAALIDIYESYPQDRDAEMLARIAATGSASTSTSCRARTCRRRGRSRSSRSSTRRCRTRSRARSRRPFWIDTVGRSSLIEIRVKLDDGVMRVMARRSQAYASNSHIFLVWMGGSSLVLLGVAILFLRNQIRPILRLAEAAESFGKGREIEFRPRGAREVRQAGHAFIEMKRRVERAIEQRTTMLNGVSHDLRTILTRFKLSLALLEQTPEVEDLKRDVDEMSRMLEGYLAFARGDAGEQAVRDRPARAPDGAADRRRAAGACDQSSTSSATRSSRCAPTPSGGCSSTSSSNAARHGERIALVGQPRGALADRPRRR